MIRVLCVDDHPLVLEGVARKIDRQPDMKVIGLGGPKMREVVGEGVEDWVETAGVVGECDECLGDALRVEHRRRRRPHRRLRCLGLRRRRA